MTAIASLTVDYLASQIASANYSHPQGTLTLCILRMRNGLDIVGKSGCLDPARFDAEVGRRIAYQDAFSKLWELEGYARACAAAGDADLFAVGGTD